MENSLFYLFEHNSSHTRGFTWAASILPRSAMFRRVCAEYNVVTEYPSGAFDVVVENGSKYPDVLGCGAYPFLIVSEEVVNAWTEAGITSFHTYPVEVAKVHSKKLRDVPPPRYFRIEIDGRCQIDLAASGVELIRFAPECNYLATQPSSVPSFRMVPGTWDGSHLFRDPLLYPRVSFCTQHILDIARQYQFTNFRFEPMEGPFDAASKGVDYLKVKKR